MSATKTNTPKSVHKRRTTIKKSALFESVEETPKRGTNLQSVTNSKRSLARMNAFEADEIDQELDMCT